MYKFIDGNSLGYAAQSTKALTVDGQEVQALFQSLKVLRKLSIQKATYPKMLWLWDGKAQFRLDLYPEYKGNRDDSPQLKEMREKYKAQRPLFEQALKHLGVTQVYAPHFEADDLAGMFVRRAEKKNQKSLLITGDQDWQQLVSELTVWHDIRRDPGKYCTHKTFASVTGVNTVAQFLEVKALQGDVSDNISGVGGLGPKAAVAIMQEFGGVKNLLETRRDSGPFTAENLPASLTLWKKKLNTFAAKNIKTFTRNYRLMDLITDERDQVMIEDMKIIAGKKDMAAFKTMCHELNFLSIIREIDRWDQSF